MIEISRIPGTNIVLNRIEGPATAQEIQDAVARTLTEADESPIIWDVRDADFKHYTYEHAKDVDEALDEQYGRMQGQRRAYVVTDELQRQLVVMMVGRQKAPFPWSVFDDLDEAIAWVSR
ncbi:MAG: hypothetical protein AAGI15_12730 [Pseudomonadota bacterium]